jgi:hypothetical protein
VYVGVLEGIGVEPVSVLVRYRSRLNAEHVGAMTEGALQLPKRLPHALPRCGRRITRREQFSEGVPGVASVPENKEETE